MALPLSFKKKLDKAHWVCQKCGEKHGSEKIGSWPTWHEGECQICEEIKAVTNFSHFGYSKYVKDNQKRN